MQIRLVWCRRVNYHFVNRILYTAGNLSDNRLKSHNNNTKEIFVNFDL